MSIRMLPSDGPVAGTRQAKQLMRKFPPGALLRFVGDEWLADLTGKVGLVLQHDVTHEGWVMNVMVCDKILPVLHGEFKMTEFEILQQ